MRYPPKQLRLRKNRQQKKRTSTQKGVVIIVALFIVALIATMTYFMMARLERDTRRTTLILREAQAAQYANGSLIWAIDQLKNNWRAQKENQIIDPVPIISPTNTVNGYQIKSTIFDMQARFNVNDLNDPVAKDGFIRLLRHVLPQMNLKESRKICDALTDWTSTVPENEINKYYLELTPAYRSPHKPMATVSEMLLVKGVTPTIFNALKPYISALPALSAKINVQTAPVPVLLSLDQSMTVDAAKAFAAARKQTPVISLGSELLKKLQIKPDKITVVSNYFLVETEVKIENQRLLLYTLLQRETKDKEALIHILWQAKGVAE